MKVKKKRKKKLKYGIPKTKIMSCVRRLWFYSLMRREAFNRDRTPEGWHRCEKCKKLTEEIQIDHEPSVIPLTSFDSYDAVFERLFCSSDKLFKLCPKCHANKTNFENSERKRNRLNAKNIIK